MQHSPHAAPPNGRHDLRTSPRLEYINAWKKSERPEGGRRRKKWKIIGREKCCGAFVMARDLLSRRYQDYFSQACAKGRVTRATSSGRPLYPFIILSSSFHPCLSSRRFCLCLWWTPLRNIIKSWEFLITDLIKFLEHTKWFRALQRMSPLCYQLKRYVISMHKLWEHMKLLKPWKPTKWIFLWSAARKNTFRLWSLFVTTELAENH